MRKNGQPLGVLHVNKRGIFRFGFQNLGETLLGVLNADEQPQPILKNDVNRIRQTECHVSQSLRCTDLNY